MWMRLIMLAVVTVWLFSIPSACSRDSLATDGAGEKTDPKAATEVAGESTVAKPVREKGPTTVVMLNESNFEQIVLKADRPVLVDFYADWCGPCKMLAPTIEVLAKEYDGEVIFGKINTDHNKRTTNKYQARALPTLIIFKNGEPQERIVGFQNKKVIQAKIDKVAG